MKINELGSNKRKKQVDEGLDFGVGNWLLRKGAGGVARAALAQRDYLSSQAFKTELATFERAFNDAVAGEIIKLDPKVDDPVANGQIQPQQGQAQQGQAQQGQAQQGQAQKTPAQIRAEKQAAATAAARAQMQPSINAAGGDQSQMSLDFGVPSKSVQQPQAQQGQAQKTPAQIRAEKQAAATATAQSQMAPYSKVSTTDTTGSPTGAQAFGSMAGQLSKQSSQPRYQDYQRTGATGVGKKTVPMKAPAQVQKLASPMTDQQLRDIEAKRQRMKEATDFETAFAILMEDSVLMESQSATEFAKDYIEAKTHQFKYIPSNYSEALNQIYAEFGQEYNKTAKFPTKPAEKLIKIVIALNQIQKRKVDSWGNTVSDNSSSSTQGSETSPNNIMKNISDAMNSGRTPNDKYMNAILAIAQVIHDTNPEEYPAFLRALSGKLNQIATAKPAQPTA